MVWVGVAFVRFFSTLFCLQTSFSFCDVCRSGCHELKVRTVHGSWKSKWKNFDLSVSDSHLLSFIRFTESYCAHVSVWPFVSEFSWEPQKHHQDTLRLKSTRTQLKYLVLYSSKTFEPSPFAFQNLIELSRTKGSCLSPPLYALQLLHLQAWW